MRSSGAYPGYLIAFEGPDGAGREEALEYVRGTLQAHGQRILVTRPLGPTLAGEIYREARLFNELSPRTLALLTASDLAERLEWSILPALDEGKVVLADRYVHRVIQGLARDLEPGWMEVLNSFAPVPDLVFHLTKPPAELASGLRLSTLDMYEAGMDIGITRDVPLSYELYQERLLLEYEHWASGHGIALIKETAPHRIVQQVEEVIGLSRGDLNLRRQGVLQLMAQLDPDPAHAVHVSDLAYSLFEQTNSIHGLGSNELELLELSLLLQGVGAGHDRDHHIHVARKIRESLLPGFTGGELELLAILAASVSISDQRELDAWLLLLPEAARQKARYLAPLARLADALNASRSFTTRWVEITLNETHCQMKLKTHNKAKAELRAIADHANLFHQVYGLEVSAVAERQGPPPAMADLAPAMPHFCPPYEHD